MYGFRNVNNLYREKKKKKNNPVTRILQIAVFWHHMYRYSRMI